MFLDNVILGKSLALKLIVFINLIVRMLIGQRVSKGAEENENRS